ncbi:MAG: beta-lactamase family protein [Bacteroidales bacterium]|nr:beta-lactamase family protein [Bacteroidales bacterium]
MTKRSILIIFGLAVIGVVILISGNEKTENNNFKMTNKVSDSLYYNVQEICNTSKAYRLDSIFNRYNKRGIFNGAVLYGERGNIIFNKAYGFSNFRKKELLTTTSSFQLASVSKMFTAMAIMILIEKDKLSYDDSLTKYIPEFPYSGITIRQLLQHRTGLPRYMSLTDKHWDINKPINNKDVIQLFVEYKPERYYRPDECFHYCNTNYILLASIVERISKKFFDVFVKENIFDPLSMDNSFVYNLRGDTAISYRVQAGTPGYRSRGWRMIEVGDYYLNGVMGDKGVYSTVEDLFKFNQALDSGALVSTSSLKEAFNPGSPQLNSQKDNYGFGWRIKTKMDSTAYHFGWWKGFRTYYIRDMKNERVLIALTNTHNGISSKVFWDIIQENLDSDELLEVYHQLE